VGLFENGCKGFTADVIVLSPVSTSLLYTGVSEGVSGKLSANQPKEVNVAVYLRDLIHQLTMERKSAPFSSGCIKYLHGLAIALLLVI
jgi:hypothetical protein